MKIHRITTAALAVAGLLLVPGEAFGHGGQYRGPGDTVPPPPGGNPPGSPNPGPATPAGTTNPGTPGGAPGPAPGVNPGGPVSPVGGADPGADFTAWTFWWEFNKEPYLDLKRHIHGAPPDSGTPGWYLGRGVKADTKLAYAPSPTQIRQIVVPALLRALKDEANPDIVTGCLIALAKIGDIKNENGESEFQDVIAARLSDSSQEISETAAVALGILADEASVPVLVELLFDTPAGRTLVQRKDVPYGTRSFAAYGLAQIGSRTARNETRQEIANELLRALRTQKTSSRDLQVACVIAMGLVPLEVSQPLDAYSESENGAEPDRLECRTQLLDCLLEFLQNEENEYLVRAHAPASLGRLLDGLEGEVHATYKQRIATALLERMSRKADDKNEVVQGAVLALGQIGDSDTDDLDRTIRETLASVPEKYSEPQARRFALIAMAKVGSDVGNGEIVEGVKDVTGFLVKHLAQKKQTSAWAGLGIGVLADRLHQAQVPVVDAIVADATTALRETLRHTKSGEKLGAYALAAGIAGDEKSIPILLAKLQRTSEHETRGYIAVGLGLLGDHQAIEPIQTIIEQSKYNPELLRQAAIALGLLGDKQLVGQLIEMIGKARGLASQAAVASALGFIGDRRSIDPLVEMLENEDLTGAARGFAAVALGIVGDSANLPWNSKIAVDLNYCASVGTLTDQQTGNGILNIL